MSVHVYNVNNNRCYYEVKRELFHVVGMINLIMDVCRQIDYEYVYKFCTNYSFILITIK